MKILCIDTSTKTCSAAVCEDNRILSQKTLNEGLTHSETLMPLIDSLLLEADTDISAIELCACVTGPGSFTGVRIGICAAKGFAQTLKIPLAAVDSLELMAQSFRDADLLAVPMIDARRGHVYSAVFENGARLTGDMAVPFEEMVKLVANRRAVFSGDGAIANIEGILALKPDALFAAGEENFPSAANAAALALRAERLDAFSILPVYLRPGRAERDKNG